MAAMKTLAKRLVRLEEQLAPVQPDYARNPRSRHRVLVSNMGKQLNLETSTCRRTLSADGALFEMVTLDGSRSGLTDAQLETFIESFPINR
jgi:hypothetical protein